VVRQRDFAALGPVAPHAHELVRAPHGDEQVLPVGGRGQTVGLPISRAGDRLPAGRGTPLDHVAGRPGEGHAQQRAEAGVPWQEVRDDEAAVRPDHDVVAHGVVGQRHAADPREGGAARRHAHVELLDGLAAAVIHDHETRDAAHGGDVEPVGCEAAAIGWLEAVGRTHESFRAGRDRNGRTVEGHDASVLRAVGGEPSGRLLPESGELAHEKPLAARQRREVFRVLEGADRLQAGVLAALGQNPNRRRARAHHDRAHHDRPPHDPNGAIRRHAIRRHVTRP
jgi:hypothetical protein